MHRFLILAILAAGVTACGNSNKQVSLPAPTLTPKVTGQQKSGQPGLKKGATSVAPAVVAVLGPGGQGCKGKPNGSGTVRFAPVRVTGQGGRFIDVALNLRNTKEAHKYGFKASLSGPATWSSGTAATITTDIQGGVLFKTRLKPSVAPGHYKIKVTLTDLGCSAHSVAYQTAPTAIILK